MSMWQILPGISVYCCMWVGVADVGRTEAFAIAPQKNGSQWFQFDADGRHGASKSGPKFLSAQKPKTRTSNNLPDISKFTKESKARSRL